MNQYDITKELLLRYNRGDSDARKLTDEDKELLSLSAAQIGEKFKVEGKPLRKGAFDLVDMGLFGLVPDEWRPRSIGQELHGESQADRAAGTIGTAAGMFTGGALAVKGAQKVAQGLKGVWNTMKAKANKERATNIAQNMYKGNTLEGGTSVDLLTLAEGSVPRLGPNMPPLLPGPGVGRMGQLARGARTGYETTFNPRDINRQAYLQRLYANRAPQIV